MTIFRNSLLILSLLIVVSGCSDDKDDGKGDEGKGKGGKLTQQPEDKTHFVPRVVYGADDRLDLYQVTDNNVLALADSTAALVNASNLQKNPNDTYTLQGRNFGSSYNLCPSEPFREQDAGAFCSGFLVAPDTLVTAGHCITSQNSCTGTKFVFGFAVKQAGKQISSFPENDVYGCSQLIHSQASNTDFAVVKLDRPVRNHLPLRVRRNGAIQTGARLVVIGHPAGLPTKVAGGASVRSVNADFFVANLDTYGGNSGSAVFNAASGEVEGILVRGETDFVTQGNCRVSNKCQDNACRGEDVTLITNTLAHLPLADEPGSVPQPEPVQDFFTSEPELAIPDNFATGVIDTLNVTGAPNGRNVQVSVDLSHSWRGDLVLVLEAPDGQFAVLSNRQGGSADNILGTFGLDLVPQNSLAPLSSVSAIGEWKLRVSDRARRDQGVLHSWSLEFVP